MKKLLAFMLAAMLLLALVSCGDPYDYNLGDYLTEGQYKGINASEKEINEKLESAIKELLDADSSEVEVTDRAIQEGDIIDMKYEGRLDGESETFKGGVGTAKDFVIGDNNFIEGFDEGIIGHGYETDDKVFDIEVTFPEDYGVDELDGKKAIFTITINSIKEIVFPELNDEFIKEKTDYSSVEEYRTKVSENIKSNLVLKEVVDNFEVKEGFPQKELKAAYDSYVEYQKRFANMYGVDLKTYVTTYMKMKMDDFWEDCAKAAAKQVKQEMVLYYITRKENITLTSKEYDEGALEIAKSYGYSSVKEFRKDKDISKDELYASVLLTKTKDFLAENATLVEDNDETTTEPDNTETTAETETSETTETEETTNE